MVDAATSHGGVEQPKEGAIAVIKNNSWDTERKNYLKTRKKQMESARGTAVEKFRAR